MNEFIEKLIGMLEELYARNDKTKKMAYEEKDWEKFDLFTHRCEGIYSAISIVNQLAEEYNGGWIPVDKTLPKKSGYYTVTEEQYSLDMRKKMGVRVSHEVQFDAEEQRWYRAKFLKVIAWKEHETPYQPKGE